MNWYLRVLKKYAVFSGRASRTEYWMFTLFNVIVAIIIAIVEVLVGGGDPSKVGVLGNLYSVAVMIPSLAVAWRRLHDIDKSGWWSFVPFLGLIYCCRKGTSGENRFGRDPWGSHNDMG